MTALPSVSVVITTIGRAEVRRAVASALGQTFRPVEVIVVNDSPEADVEYQLTDLKREDVPVRVLASGGAGGNVARNLGIDAAAGECIALLDDDDVWFAGKLEAQATALRDRAPGTRKRTVVTCRAVDERTARVEPADVYDGGRLEEWLFDLSLRRPSRRRTLQTSGFFLPTSLARVIRFDEQLASHQDWDFLLRAYRDHGVELTHMPAALYWFSAAAPAKVSATSRLIEEQEWAARLLEPRSKQLSCYFLTVAAPRALQRGDRAAARRAVRRGLSGRVSVRSTAYLAAYLMTSLTAHRPPARRDGRRPASSGGSG